MANDADVSLRDAAADDAAERESDLLEVRPPADPDAARLIAEAMTEPWYQTWMRALEIQGRA